MAISVVPWMKSDYGTMRLMQIKFVMECVHHQMQEQAF